jgi:two-component system, OmpR family, response regulator ChvI
LENNNIPYRIMLIDDNEDIVTSFKIGLEENGFSVEAFLNPFEALARFKENDKRNYDLLLIDIKMPGMNGFELYRQIKKIDDKVKICLITAYVEIYNTLKQSYPEIKTTCFIKKPIETIDLVARLKQELKASI